MIRRVFFAFTGACVIGLVAMVGLKVGPSVENILFPKRIHDQNIGATRSADRVCWVWSSDKVRNGLADNVDVFLDVLTPDGHTKNTFVPTLTNMITGLPWQSANVLHVKVGDHSEVPYCVDVPSVIAPSDRVRVRFTPIYHGWQDLWDLPLRTPDIVDPPWAEAPL